MTQVDYSAILDKRVGSAPAPKPVPNGTYVGEIDGLPKVVERNTKAGPRGVLQVRVKLSEAGDDVDPTELEEMGGLTNANGRAKTVTSDFWLDEDSMWVLDNFLATFEFGDISYQDALEQLPGQQVKVGVIVDTFESNGQTRKNNKVRGIYAA